MIRNADTRISYIDAKNRKFYEVKKITMYFACGKSVHWLDERYYCLKKMDIRATQSVVNGGGDARHGGL